MNSSSDQDIARMKATEYLKQLKQKLSYPLQGTKIRNDEINIILAWLDAAELVCKEVSDRGVIDHYPSVHNLWDKWRRLRGIVPCLIVCLALLTACASMHPLTEAEALRRYQAKADAARIAAIEKCGPPPDTSGMSSSDAWFHSNVYFACAQQTEVTSVPIGGPTGRGFGFPGSSSVDVYYH